MTAPPSSWDLVDLVALGDSVPDAPTIAGFLYPRMRHLVIGETESCKTWGLLCACVSEIQLGHNVLWIDFEMDSRQVLNRLRALELDDRQIRDHFIYLHPVDPIGAAGAAAALDALVAERRPTIAVLDAMTGALQLHGLDPNKGIDIETIYRAVVDRCRAHGAATAVIDHLTKDRENRGKYAIGSERKVSAVDVVLAFEVVRTFGRGRSGLAHIKVNKDRPGGLRRPRVADLELVSDAATGSVKWKLHTPKTADSTTEQQAFRPTALMEKVSRYLETQAHPVPRREIEKAITGKAQFVRIAIDALVAEGYAGETSGPNNSRIVAPKKAFRDNQFVPGSSHADPAENDPGSSLDGWLDQAGIARSSRFVPGSSPVRPDPFVPTASPLTEGEQGRSQEAILT
jgi:hypothetical protein